MAGRKSKYEECILPHLEKIKEKIKEGVIEEDIAKSLGICVATLNNYKHKYPELAAALSQDKGSLVLDKLVNSGIDAACGQWVTEEKIILQLDEDGNATRKVKEIYKKFIPANATLNKFYSQVYGKDKGFTNDPLEYELKKAKHEFDIYLAKNKEWLNDEDDHN